MRKGLHNSCDMSAGSTPEEGCEGSRFFMYWLVNALMHQNAVRFPTQSWSKRQEAYPVAPVRALPACSA